MDSEQNAGQGRSLAQRARAHANRTGHAAILERRQVRYVEPSTKRMEPQ